MLERTAATAVGERGDWRSFNDEAVIRVVARPDSTGRPIGARLGSLPRHRRAALIVECFEYVEVVVQEVGRSRI